MKFEKPPENLPEKPEPKETQEIKKLAAEHGQQLARRNLVEQIGKLNIGVGDIIISATGTRRAILGFDIDKLFFDVITKRPGEPAETEKLGFQTLLDGMGRGAVVKIEHAEEK